MMLHADRVTRQKSLSRMPAAPATSAPILGSLDRATASPCGPATLYSWEATLVYTWGHVEVGWREAGGPWKGARGGRVHGGGLCEGTLSPVQIKAARGKGLQKGSTS